MHKALVLVRNLESSAQALDFGEFTIKAVGLRFKELRETLSSVDVNPGDRILEKAYVQLPPGPLGSAVGGIPNDIEDILLVLRLFRPQDISFVKVAVVLPSGIPAVQLPYRAMNDLNSYPRVPFNIEPEERRAWTAFADAVRESQSWSSDWFATAKRFFLSGGAKPFDPKGDDVDRIVDYATALESTLVPERDYNTRRVSRRSSALVAPDDPAEAAAIAKIVKRFYDIRSQIVHGSALGNESREWLFENCGQLENLVRQILVNAVQALPPGEEDRRVVLAGLYDPTDEDRGNSALEKFREIRTAEVRKTIANKIARLAE